MMSRVMELKHNSSVTTILILVWSQQRTHRVGSFVTTQENLNLPKYGIFGSQNHALHWCKTKNIKKPPAVHLWCKDVFKT